MHDPTFEIPEPKPEEIYPPCSECDGTGRIYDWNWKSPMYGVDIDCPYCNGLGYIVPEEDDEIPY